MKTLIRIFSSVKRHPVMALSSFLLSFAGALLVLVAPIMTERFFDVIIPEGRRELILPTTLISITLIIARQLLLMCSSILNASLEQRLVHELRHSLYDKVQRLPLAFFNKTQSGDIMSRINNDVPAMEAVIVQGVGSGLGGVVQAVVVLLYMLNQHVGLTLMTLSPMPLVALLTWLYSKYGEPRYRQESEAEAELHGRLHDTLAGITQIKAYTAEEQKHREFKEGSSDLYQAQMRVVRANAVTWPTVSMIAESGLLAMLGAGAYWVLIGEVNVGVMLSFLAAWGYFYEPFSRIGPLSKIFVKGKASGDRVFQYLDLLAEPQLKEGKSASQLTGHIQFKEVSFRYHEGQEFTLKDISLEASPGQTIALIGATGAGKSTLLNLLSGFYLPQKGAVLVEGISTKEISKDWLRRNTGFVTQDNFLFNTTVRMNLLLGKPTATDAELKAALQAANAWEFVQALPKQLETVTGERGSRLSGGEKQRICIARALLKNPPLLLLDEATSAVDHETERQIQDALDTLRENRTTFVIAHRLTTIESADLICVMKDGQISEVRAGECRHERNK